MLLALQVHIDWCYYWHSTSHVNYAFISTIYMLFLFFSHSNWAEGSACISFGVAGEVWQTWCGSKLWSQVVWGENIAPNDVQVLIWYTAEVARQKSGHYWCHYYFLQWFSYFSPMRISPWVGKMYVWTCCFSHSDLKVSKALSI